MSAQAETIEKSVRADVEAALTSMRQVLDATRVPQYAADVPHKYTDKFTIVDRATQAALVGQLNILCDGFGLDAETLQGVLTRAAQERKTVTLRFDESSSCSYVRTDEYERADPTRHEKRSIFGKSSTRVVRKVINHIWEFKASWRISVYVGAFTTPADAVELKRRTGAVEIATVADYNPDKAEGGARAPPTKGPHPARTVGNSRDVDITWLTSCIQQPDVPALPVARVVGADEASKGEGADDPGLPAASSSAGSSDDASTRLVCDKQHALRASQRLPNMKYTCDRCSKAIADDELMMSCRACDFDLCPDCSGLRTDPNTIDAAAAAGAAAPPPAVVQFFIRRRLDSCHTPSNNEDVRGVVRGASKLCKWMAAVEHSLAAVHQKSQSGGVSSHATKSVPNLERSSISSDVFNPVPAFLTLEETRASVDLSHALPAPDQSTDGGASTDSGGAAPSSQFIASADDDDAPADDSNGNEASSPEAQHLSLPDFDALLRHHRATLRAKFQQLSLVLPPGNADRGQNSEGVGLRTTAEGIVRVACVASVDLWAAQWSVVQSVEAMLYRQIVDAIGKTIGAKEFAEYMEYHKSKLFKQEFCPKPFSYAIRRPDHYPDGVLSIEKDDDSQPITTTVVHRQRGHSMKLPLGAAMQVELEGEHFVHAQVRHQFSCTPSTPEAGIGRPPPKCPGSHTLAAFRTPRNGFRCDLCHARVSKNAPMFGCRGCNWDACRSCYQAAMAPITGLDAAQQSRVAAPATTLIARARQFSSFILVLGNLHAADVFNPVQALIMQNKDEVKIPLIMTTIPTPKEFRKQVSSLSPEQQAFAKAYRKMQLSGTLFAVAIVQIKPNLERLLNLHSGSLTKEVKMCQELMTLFIQHQIPSDQLKYTPDEDEAADDDSPRCGVDAVKKHINTVNGMISLDLRRQLKDASDRNHKANVTIDLDGLLDLDSSASGSSSRDNSDCSSDFSDSDSDCDSLNSSCDEDEEEEEGGERCEDRMRPSRNSKFDRQKSKVTQVAKPGGKSWGRAGLRRRRARSASNSSPAGGRTSRRVPSAGKTVPPSKPQQNEQTQQEQNKSESDGAETALTTELSEAVDVVDYTKIPHQMNAAFDQLDVRNYTFLALRSSNNVVSRRVSYVFAALSQTL